MLRASGVRDADEQQQTRSQESELGPHAVHEAPQGSTRAEGSDSNLQRQIAGKQIRCFTGCF